MANEENLKPFQKGKSGNPNGRPIGAPNRSKTILDILSLEQKAVNPITKIEETLNQYQLIVLAMLKKARTGDVRAAQWLVENGYGKLMENFEVNQTIDSRKLEDTIIAITTNDKDS